MIHPDYQNKMPRIINDEELASVVSLAAPDRYSYFIKQSADLESIWSLSEGDGWVLMNDDHGKELVPIWPHERFAASCATEKWANAVPRLIELDKWLANWIPGMLRDGRQIAVFPTPEDKGIAVRPSQLKEDLEEELLKYE